MTESLFITVWAFLISSLRLSTPLLWAVLAGLISERAGVIQIALEGLMLIGALVGATVATLTHSPELGFVMAAIAGATLAGLQGFFVLHLRADQIVTGTAINILAAGLAPFATKILFHTTGATPPLAQADRFVSAPAYFAILCLVLIWYAYHYTKLGLILQFAGEAPMALTVTGVRTRTVRWIALLCCGGLAGFGGGSLSLFLASAYSPNMTAGRGFMALGALIFGKWRPLPAACACLFFGMLDALQIRMQGSDLGVPVQFVQILPYLATIIALAGIFGQSSAPKALGKGDPSES